MYIYFEYQWHIIKIEMVNYIYFARSAPQVFLLQDEYTVCFSFFLILVLCNCSANCRIHSQTLAARATSEGY